MGTPRHAKRPPGFLSGGTCARCKGQVNVTEAMKVRPGELASNGPMHDECYDADVIRLGLSA